MPLINGDNGPNNLLDTAGDDTINGLDGNDTITVTNGNDSANGGNDFDTLIVNYGGSSADISGGLTSSIYSDGPAGNAQDVGFSAFERFVITTGSGDDTIGTGVFGNGNDVVNLGSGNDFAETGTGDDVVNGGDDDDNINVGTGNDTADGGSGQDRISANMSAAVSAIVWNLQTNFYSGPIGSFTNFEYVVVTTGTGNDVIVTGTGNLDDGATLGDGDDSVTVVRGSDNVTGGDGLDTLIVDYGASTTAITGGLNSYGNGTDRNVAFAAFERFVITTGSGEDVIDTSNFSGNDVLSLGAGNDLAATGDGNDSLNGGDGADAIDGGTGADQMSGGDGNDLIFVDNVGDQAIETNATASGGIDTVQSGVSFTLGANIERLTLVGAAVSGTGNGLANLIIGNGVANSLNGGLGADTMQGGGGDDTYTVDNAGDVVSETSEFDGNDLVRSSVSYTLAAHLEKLTLTGTGAVNATGNGLDNILIGNSGNNQLNGGVGADQMRGLAGDDTYFVDHAGDQVFEIAPGDGTDTIRSSVTFSLGQYQDNLVLTGAAAIDGNGNTGINSVTGNSAANTLNGGGGADTMTGGLGDDTYIVDQAGDAVVEGAGSGTDTVRSLVSYTLSASIENLVLTGTGPVDGSGNGAANTISGNNAVNHLSGAGAADVLTALFGNDVLDGGDGNDKLFGGYGNDTMTGGTGFDWYYFDAALNASGNRDAITDFNVAQDTIYLDRDIFTGIAANGFLAAGAFRNGAVALDTDDRILYNAATGDLRYDSDGIGGAAAILFATVTPGLVLTNTDFVAYI